MIFLDTHAIAWLHDFGTKRFRPSVLTLMRESELFYSPISLVELKFMEEKGRLGDSPAYIVNELKRGTGLKSSENNFSDIIAEAMKISWTRDPFDLLIVAECMITNAHLVTRDHLIRKNYENAIW